MSKAKQRAARLLRKYDKMRAELRAVEHELNLAVRAYADEQKFGWYDRDKFRVALMIERERKEKAA